VTHAPHTALAAALLFLPCLRAGEHAQQPPPVLTVYLKDAGRCAPGILDEMQSEVEEIMRPVGLPLEWRHLDLSQQTEAVAAVILTFVGTCRGHGECAVARPRSRMGWTHMTDGDILPFCSVDCDRVREMVAPLVRHETGRQRDRLYARAIGRVVAHELYHILANTTGHARCGLAKARLTASELVLEACRFGVSEIEQIRKGVVRTLFGGRAPNNEQVNGGG
jgi:hypothetical protein